MASAHYPCDGRYQNEKSTSPDDCGNISVRDNGLLLPKQIGVPAAGRCLRRSIPTVWSLLPVNPSKPKFRPRNKVGFALREAVAAETCFCRRGGRTLAFCTEG